MGASLIMIDRHYAHLAVTADEATTPRPRRTSDPQLLTSGCNGLQEIFIGSREGDRIHLPRLATAALHKGSILLLPLLAT
jgi:hypothetical protein